MSDEKHRIEVAADDDHRGKHPFALGVLAGAAVGVGVGLLFAPRTGAQMRKEVGNQLTHMKGSCSTGYHRAKDAASDWAHRSRGVYDTTREKVIHSAHETRQYIREVSDAVTRKGHEPAPSTAKPDRAVAVPRDQARAVVTGHSSPAGPRAAGVTEVPVREVTAKQGA